MNVFITGISGFIGRYLLEVLLAKYPEARVYCLVRSLEKIQKVEGVIYLEGSLDRLDFYADVLKDCDYIFHVAANARFGSSFDYVRDNVRPVEKLVSIVKNSTKKGRIIFVSSIGAFDRAPGDTLREPIRKNSVASPRSSYGASKLAAEGVLDSSGLEYTIIRPGWVYGYGMRTDSHLCAFAQLIRKAPWIRFCDFPGRVSTVHVNDLVTGMVACIGNPRTIREAYFVNSESFSIGRILHGLSERMGYSRRRSLHFSDFGLTRWLHRFLPIQLTNLFQDYLVCDGADFWEVVQVKPKEKLLDSLDEVIASDPRGGGFNVVTGANSGIGLSLVKQLLDRGDKVIAIDIQSSNLELMVSSRFKFFKVDLSEQAEITQLVKELNRLPIRTLINNAGVGYKGDFANSDPSKNALTVEVNINAPLLLTRLLLDHLRGCKSTIVNITSSTSEHPLPHMSVYAASKAFLRSWSLALAQELKASNRVVTFAPSGTDTGFQGNAGVKKINSKGLLSPEFVAKKILKATHAGPIDISIGLSSKLLNFFSYLMPLRIKLEVWSFLFRSQR